jgi:hypothetical protein
MRDQRNTEVHVLGYRIDRVTAFKEDGELAVRWYEVLAPESAAVLGLFAHRAEAEREIVARELRALPMSAAA